MNESAASPIPDDLPALRELVVRLSKQLGQQAARIAQLEVELKLRIEMLRLERIRKYGPKGEQLSDQQSLLLDEEPGVTAEEVEQEAAQADKAPVKKRRNPSPGRVELPAHLPRVEEIVPCPPEQCRCGQCGAETKVIGHDTAEMLDRKPPEYFVRVVKREKRACPGCPEAGVARAPAPARILEKSKLSDGLLIDVVLAKYRDHQPLYRQSAGLLADAGVDIARSTLCTGVMKAGELCAALARVMKEDLFQGGYIQADETPVGVLSPETKGRNHQSYLFEYSRPRESVVFDFRMGRGREGPSQFLKGYQGLLQSDGYTGYDKLQTASVQHLGCMAHLRRGFVDAAKVAPEDPLPREIVELIKPLYRVETLAREKGLDSAARHALRQEHSVPLMRALKERIVEIRQDILPASALGKACNYALNQWTRVERYLEHGQAEIDNNWCENAIRPLALGRKNWLHIGSPEAGPKIAGILSIMETCRRLDINVRAYLADVLPGLADKSASQLIDLTPMAWKARQAAL